MPLFLKYFICIDAIPLDYRVDLLVLYRSTGKPKKCDFAWRNKSNNTDCTGFSRLGWVLQVACFASNFRACSRKDCGIAAKAQQAKHVPLCPLFEGVFNASARGSSNRVFSRFDRFHTDLCGTVDSYAKVLGAAGQMRRIGACHQGFGRGASSIDTGPAKKLAFNNHDFLTSARWRFR